MAYLVESFSSLFKKKKDSSTLDSTSVTIASPDPVTPSHDGPREDGGFVLLDSGSVPYSVQVPSQTSTDAGLHSMLEDVPFEINSVCQTLWNLQESATHGDHRIVMLKEIDWDSLNYSFDLEKEIIRLA